MTPANIPWHLLHKGSSTQLRALTTISARRYLGRQTQCRDVVPQRAAFSTSSKQQKQEGEEEGDPESVGVSKEARQNGKPSSVASALEKVLPPQDDNLPGLSSVSYDPTQGPLTYGSDQLDEDSMEREESIIEAVEDPSENRFGLDVEDENILRMLYTTSNTTVKRRPLIRKFLVADAPPVQRPSSRLTHLNEDGEAHMVDVGDKVPTKRTAIATGTVLFSTSQTYPQLEPANNKKGDVFATARIAGIQAAKMTPQLIPLCHPIALTSVTVVLKPIPPAPEASSGRFRRWARMPFGGVKIAAKVECVGQTGVEMEALTAVNVAALTIVDMCKAVDKGMAIERCRVILKTGGKSGTWRYKAMSDPEVENM